MNFSRNLAEFWPQNLAFFFDFWRRAAHLRQKSKKVINENLAFFPIFGGVLRTAAKNRKKCLMKTWHFFRFLAACCAPPPKLEKNALRKLGNKIRQNSAKILAVRHLSLRYK